MTQAPQYVSPASLEETLASLRELPDDPTLGFFGPDSATWRMNRECAVFLGAGRAALLQLAHPWVSTSLAHHSNLMNDAIGRFHSTFRVVYTMLFGTRAQALAASQQLYRRHSTIQGELPAAVGAHRAHEHYAANEIAALRWVFATLVDSAVLAYEFVLPPLRAEERELYYKESKRMAALCGIPPDTLPPDWNSFTQYMLDMLASPALAVDGSASALGQSVLSGVGTWVRPPRWYLALTAAWLPPRLREAFALPLGNQERKALEKAARRLPRMYPYLPKMLRFVGPYHEAEARLRGRSPGALARRSNRFWMGRPRLMFSELS